MDARDLISGRIFKNASQFNFYQIVRLLEYRGYSFRPGLGTTGRQLKLKPSFYTSFPPADIRHGFANQNEYTLELNFMGLYGVDAALPNYFVQACARDDDRGACLRAFFDIFNQRLYQLLFLAWKKYQPLVQYEQGGQQYKKMLRALSGDALNDRDQEEQVAAGLLGAKQHHRAGLEGLLQEFLGHTQVSVSEFIPRWIMLARSARLGQPLFCLNADIILGARLLTCTQQINISIGPVSLQAAQALFPTAQLGVRIWYLVKRYLQPGLDFSIGLQIQIPRDARLHLGVDAMKLGWTSWVGELGAGLLSVSIAASVWAYYFAIQTVEEC